MTIGDGLTTVEVSDLITGCGFSSEVTVAIGVVFTFCVEFIDVGVGLFVTAGVLIFSATTGFVRGGETGSDFFAIGAAGNTSGFGAGGRFSLTIALEVSFFGCG